LQFRAATGNFLHDHNLIGLDAGASACSGGRWSKSVGEPVSIGEPLVEIDSCILTHEIQAPITGILSKILVKDAFLPKFERSPI
jgi:biotin carboxyl carrier protein